MKWLLQPLASKFFAWAYADQLNTAHAYIRSKKSQALRNGRARSEYPMREADTAQYVLMVLDLYQGDEK